MMPTSSLPFTEIASDLYLPTSFQAPRSSQPLPEPPTDWVYYGPQGDQPAPPFATFIASPTFKQAQQQILERVAQCEHFAETHFNAAEATVIHGHFRAFRDHLRSGDGVDYFSESQLCLLYSLGKQSFDNFCLLLDQPDIALHERKTALRELADQVRACRAAAPAFIQAQAALQCPQGTLRGEYWRVTCELFDATLRRFVNEDIRHEDAQALASWESHYVNRLRLELGLPGADPHDTFSLGRGLVTPEQVEDCALRLLRDCRPADIVMRLASDYRARLLDLTSQRLGLAIADIDLNDELHMKLLMDAARDLAPSFPGISLKSLVEEDIDSDTYRLRSDDALVARDLLQALAELGCVRPPVVGTLTRGRTADSRWALRHLDHRIFYVRDYLDGTGGAGEYTSARLRHLAALPPPGLDDLSQRAKQAVLNADTPEALQAFPAEWLSSADTSSQLLGRLGPDRAVRWTQGQIWNERTLGLTLRGATAGGHVAPLSALLDQYSGALVNMVMNAAGPEVLAVALDHANPEVATCWLKFLKEGIVPLTPALRAAVLSGPRGKTVLRLAALRHGGAVLDATLALITDMRAKASLSQRQWLDQFDVALSHLLPSPHAQQGLTAIGQALEEASRQRWISPNELKWTLEGLSMMRTYPAAIGTGHLHNIAWFRDFVLHMTQQGHIAPKAGGLLLTGPKGAVNDALSVAMGRGELRRLATVLGGLTAAAEQRWIDTHRLFDLLRCRGGGPITELCEAMVQNDARCVNAWINTVLMLCGTGLLEASQVAQLLCLPVVNEASLLPGERDVTQRPFIHVLHLLLQRCGADHLPRSPVRAWGTAILQTAKAGVLSRLQILNLLAGTFNGTTALHETMKSPSQNPKVIHGLVTLYVNAQREGVITETELWSLLNGRGADDGAATALEAASLCNLMHYGDALLAQVRQRRLALEPAGRLLRDYEPRDRERQAIKTRVLIALERASFDL